ncbi:MAG: DUF447 family protein [Methylococcaceae bacterium]|nr:DUF447 family protein [Methylococcaceae bacterium]MCI0733409.1 DUF447 family protein [Methylococcaceae bacterium]
MIREIVITSWNNAGRTHIAPMGIHDQGRQYLVMPFKPSTTLDNILETGYAVMNCTDDVRIYAGCLTGRRDFALCNTERIAGKRLAGALAHTELKLVRYEEDGQRPRLYCEAVHEASHQTFRGFNRAQFSVLEAAILVSRLHLLPWKKIETEIEYLRIGVDKTAGERELEAWHWLMQRIDEFRKTHPEPAGVS